LELCPFKGNDGGEPIFQSVKHFFFLRLQRSCYRDTCETTLCVE